MTDMTRKSTHTYTRRGSHRGGRDIVGALVPSLLAVAGVASLITALAVWQGQDPTQPTAAFANSSPSVSREAVSAPGSPSSSAKASSTPTAEASTKAPAKASPKASKKARPTTPSAAPAPTFDIEVVVLNQSGRSGLAGSVATNLRDAGWTVPAVGNFRGVVPATTVYYPPGEDAAALAVASDLAAPPRVRPRFGNLSTSRLTVVVTTSYPG